MRCELPEQFCTDITPVLHSVICFMYLSNVTNSLDYLKHTGTDKRMDLKLGHIFICYLL